MIETRTKAKTTEQDSQEINIYKLAGDKQWRISCSIPKFARKYRKFLDDGFEVINQATVQLIEIHGTLNNKGVSLSMPREMSEEEKAMVRERFMNRVKKS